MIESLLEEQANATDVQQKIVLEIRGTNESGQPIDDYVPIGCHEVKSNHTSRVYRIRTQNTGKPFFAYCQAAESGSMWTVIVNRIDNGTNFFRNWADYKRGFGNVNRSFWIGLEKLHEVRSNVCFLVFNLKINLTVQLTSAKLHELYVWMEDFDGSVHYARYSTFGIAGCDQNYMLNLLGDYSGTAGIQCQHL